MHKRAFSISEFCSLYAVGRTKAYAEISSGRLRAVKAGRRTLIPEDSAEAWLAALPDSKKRA
jgi:excisionase family DNA binding protein